MDRCVAEVKMLAASSSKAARGSSAPSSIAKSMSGGSGTLKVGSWSSFKYWVPCGHLFEWRDRPPEHQFVPSNCCPNEPLVYC
jgi:hypothetical protein